MNDLNKVFLIGRVTRDVGSDERSFAYTPAGTAKAEVGLAVNHTRKNGDEWVDECNFFTVTIWGKAAETLKPFLKRGKQVAIEGRLKQDTWEKDGKKNSRVSIIADNVQLLGKKDEGAAPQSAPQNDGGFTEDSSSDFPEDIPF